MLEYLILNGKFEAARHYNDKAQTSLREELMHLFNKGNRQQFLDIYNLLHKQSKLEFYLRVYFLIYNIHPSLKGKSNIPQPEKMAFKDYLDTKGAQLAKTNQFLEFYALPFIKKPLEHLAFKSIFKKQWVAHLKEKLQIFITEQQRLLKIEINKLFENQPVLTSSSHESKALQQKVKQMQKINKKLFQQVKQFTEKYHILEDSHKVIMDGYHTHMMQSQSKWFQITKQLVECSKNFIQMIISSGSECLSDRKFLKFKRRTQKYERFVTKKFDDLISHSEDISIFDRPSISDMSYSMAPHSQKNLTQAANFLEDYIPTNFEGLKQYLKKGNAQQKISIINGLYWRVLKSKNKQIRKLNTLGILHYDALGIKSGEIQQLLTSRQLMKPVVRLIQVISLDNIGKKIAFNNNNLLKDFVGLINHCEDPSSFQYIVSALGQISSEKCFKLSLIYLDIIQACVGILRDGKYSSNETILENTVAIMLNMLEKSEALKKYEKQRDIFEVLKKHLRGNFRITRTLIYGIIFALLQSEQLFKRAHVQKMPQFFDNILAIDPTINRTQLKYLKNKLIHFEPKQKQLSADEEQADYNEEEQDFEIEEDYLNELQQMMVFHDETIKKFSLKGKEAAQQTKQIKQLLRQYRQNRVPTFQKVDENQPILRVNSPKQRVVQLPPIQTPYIKEISDRQLLIKSEKPLNKKLNNFFIGENKPIKNKNRDSRLGIGNQKQQISFQNQERRMKKSVSADRGIVHNIQNIQNIQTNQISQSNRFSNKITQFKTAEERKYRSPQQKKPREEVLKQLNQQIKAEQKKVNTESQQSMYVSERHRGGGEQTEVFQSRPKLRRTPPHQ